MRRGGVSGLVLDIDVSSSAIQLKFRFEIKMRVRQGSVGTRTCMLRDLQEPLEQSGVAERSDADD